jgi:hypothetical protein
MEISLLKLKNTMVFVFKILKQAKQITRVR